MRLFIASCVIAALGTILMKVGLNIAHDGYFPSIAIVGFFMIPLGFVGMVMSALASVYDISTRTQHELAADAGCFDKDIVVMTPRATDLANLIISSETTQRRSRYDWCWQPMRSPVSTSNMISRMSITATGSVTLPD